MRTPHLLTAAVLLAPHAPAMPADAEQIKAGEAVYARCMTCHSLEADRTGPRHCGLFGRSAGSIKGFDYSDAMKRSNIVWDEKSLDRFLADPMKAIPGTSMGYAGVADKRERAALIAYLRQANATPPCTK